MSVLIKGMEMPKSCDECELCTCYVREDGTEENYRCVITFYPIHEFNERHEYCPLVGIPPHGRLIDADALRLLYDFSGYKPTGDMTEEEFDRLMCRLPVIRANIDDAPTIIESTIGQLNSDPAVNEANANTSNELNALDCVEERKKGEWDMFDLISSAYYGKGMYFKQDNGTVYSRHSNKYMTVDEAIKEFISLINEENIAYVPSVTTAWTDGEAPTYVLQKRGKWINPRPDSEMCSACGVRFSISSLFAVGGNEEPNFCPNCGADMRGREDD